MDYLDEEVLETSLPHTYTTLTWKRWVKETLKYSFTDGIQDDVLETLNRNSFIKASPYRNPELVPNKRYVLIEWLLEVVHELKIELSTIFVAVNLVDIFSSLCYVETADYQWYGLTCLWICDKMVSVEPRSLSKYTELIMEDQQPFYDLLKMETTILMVVECNVPSYNVSSYYPLPFQMNMPTNNSYRLMNHFQEFTHFVCFVAIQDYFTVNHYRVEEIAFVVFAFCTQYHYNAEYHFDAGHLSTQHRALFDRLNLRIRAIMADSSHLYNDIFVTSRFK